MLKRRRYLLDEQHRAAGSQYRIAPCRFFDLQYGLAHPLDRRLRAPAEGVTPKARRELPAMGFCIGHSNTRLKRR
jgi:hypothetical protein